MIDSHAHIASCQEPAQTVVEAAVAAGVNRIVAIGMDSQSCQRELEHAERFSEVFFAAGWHPNNAATLGESQQKELTSFSAHPRCVAIGETGLDYYREGASRNDQERAFRFQIELARDTDKPLILHIRAAENDALRILAEEAADLTVILHCFSMPDRIEECVEKGYYISFAGNLTYPRSEELRLAATQVPDRLLLVETDSPYLSPQPVRGKRCQPAYVKHTAAALADLRDVSYRSLEETVEENAARIFGWS